MVWTLINPSDGVMKLQLTDVLVAVTTDVACWYTPPIYQFNTLFVGSVMIVLSVELSQMYLMLNG